MHSTVLASIHETITVRMLLGQAVACCLFDVAADEIFDCVASNGKHVIVGAADGMLHMFPICDRDGRTQFPVSQPSIPNNDR